MHDQHDHGMTASPKRIEPRKITRIEEGLAAVIGELRINLSAKETAIFHLVEANDSLSQELMMEKGKYRNLEIEMSRVTYELNELKQKLELLMTPAIR